MDISKVQDKVQINEAKSDAIKEARSQKVQERNQDVEAAATELSRNIDQAGTVAWSADAVALGEGIEAAKAAPDSRAERVAELKAQIQSGRYKVNAEKVAEKMLHESFAESLLTRKS